MLKAAMSIKAELEATDTLTKIFTGSDSTLKTPLREVSVSAAGRVESVETNLVAFNHLVVATIIKFLMMFLSCFMYSVIREVIALITSWW